MQRILLFPALLAAAIIAVGCSNGESAPAKKTPEEIAELQADCIKNAEGSTPEDLAAIAECMEKARQ